MRVLAFNPYHGGSHAQFLEQWCTRSRHEFTMLTLPARHFKWRIRQASVGLAARAQAIQNEHAPIDVLWTTSMLDAAELRSLLPHALRNTPLVVYFHENQCDYPSRTKDVRDVNFCFINWVSALAADEVWFNSQFNRRSFLSGMEQVLRKMPDHNELESLAIIERKSRVEAPGFEPDRQPRSATPAQTKGPLRIAWVGRWEHDKRPDIFFEGLRLLKREMVDFRVHILGQQFREWPEEFHRAHEEFRDQLTTFGFLPNEDDYWSTLHDSDVVVSTADHEFFGIAILEAVSAGCVPLLPRRLVYPELYPEACLYPGDAVSLAASLSRLASLRNSSAWDTFRQNLGLDELVERHDMRLRAGQLDDALQRVRRI